MKYKFYKNTNLLAALCVAVLGAGFLASCNKSFPRLIEDDSTTPNPEFSITKRKVLYLIVDGAVGSEVQIANPPGLAKLATNSIYSWSSLVDMGIDSVTNGTAWANMMAGVDKSKHKVSTDDFSNNNLADYPSFITRIKQSKPDMKMSVYSTSAAFDANLAAAADNRKVCTDDAAVETELVSRLLNTTDNSDLVVGEFNSVDLAGAAHAYKATDPEYLNAILTVDGRIQRVINTLKQRPGYAHEKWLVIVASNKGSMVAERDPSGDNSVFADQRRDAFLFFYSPSYGTTFLEKPNVFGLPWMGKVVKFDNPGWTSYQESTPKPIATVADGSFFNFNKNTGKDYTVNFKWKANGDFGWWNSCTILSKQKGSTGWRVYVNSYDPGNDQSLAIAFRDGDSWQRLSWKKKIDDRAWHDFTFTIFTNGSDQRVVNLYLDGTKMNSMVLGGGYVNNTLSADAPLRIGVTPVQEGWLDCYLADLKIFNKSMTDVDVANYWPVTGIPGTHPCAANVMGYWPCIDGVGGSIADESGYGHNFSLSGPFNWFSFEDLKAPFKVTPRGDVFNRVPHAVDIATQTLSWLYIDIDPDWELEGRVWTPNSFNN